jgi:hypothetical protein
MDDGGGFIGDTSHPSTDDALRTAQQEFRLTQDQLPTSS